MDDVALASPPLPPPPPAAAPAHPKPSPGDLYIEQLHFERRVMSDVYALLDYLTGRSRPSLAYPRYQRSRHRVTTRGVTECEKKIEQIESDLENDIALVHRAMRIGQLFVSQIGFIPKEDAAFLVKARDLLNTRAAPATGSSIGFTNWVIHEIHVAAAPVGSSDREPDIGELAFPVFTAQDRDHRSAARKLAKSIRHTLRTMCPLLVLTLLLSAYVAWGKLLLDTRDAVLRDYGANLSSIGVEMAASSALPFPKLLDDFCKRNQENFVVYESCFQHRELEQRKEAIERQLHHWTENISLKATRMSVPVALQQAAVAVGAFGNYVLPVLYGALGSVGSVLRQFNRRLAERLLRPRDLRANHIRMMLGTVTGACIGLFFNNSAGAAQATGLGGAAVTLSASALAFLAGYGVEPVFRTLDRVINHIFKLDESTREDDPPHAPRRYENHETYDQAGLGSHLQDTST